MFTGIVEELGVIKTIKNEPKSMQLTIESKKVIEDIHLGDSIAINGVCLTVISFSTKQFTVDVMPETVKATNIHALQTGQVVNLERAMPANGRFGGHFVSGHVDGTGIILRKRKLANAVYVDIGISKELSKFCMMKGSIAIDGISLTIFDVKPTQITVSLIPHTFDQTILGIKKEQEVVNIENDLLGKYIIHHLERKDEKSSITLDFLKENGF
ncbi:MULTISPECIES: riboflavin synthase [unclassified Rummeliibacillus]|uniref:riboflavin synthase n=1 Tax=unclassified Rummeliibacillus TaxID=2622809 RepID=UPI000E66A155|nr:MULTISPECIES: riboflavin synthase [unclassified Rummeliibacillus]RIJ63144.1 riboflavin synthase [Rummeliibacillus sp. POC4]RPJ95626.1 riboflavin synthase [Rummeliibacillus sp. TYF005]